ncbi:autotransporter outer membrane beta-barrel domain-containing protein [Yersinia alsatica]|uniref:autotransporter outer membrane beta-barrel domain-containing protein n=1 Tax=Yersinia alsatica TaxID=2890317 RepID=UPI0011A87058|nr:autotransporter outer membrane beta-barrel domain-containing protein [Yersinia alsatica]
MNHRNTLNTRLLPLSILISSLVSGGAMAVTAVPIGDFQRMANGGNFQFSSGSPAANSKLKSNTMLESMFPIDMNITPEMLAELQQQYNEQKKVSDEEIANLTKEVDATLDPAEKALKQTELDKFKKIAQNENELFEATIAYANDKNQTNLDNLSEKLKNKITNDINLLPISGQFTAKEIESLIEATLNNDDSKLSSEITNKIDSIKQQQQAELSALDKFQDFVTQNVLTPEQAEKLQQNVKDKYQKINAEAIAKLANEQAQAADDEAKKIKTESETELNELKQKEAKAESAKNEANKNSTKLKDDADTEIKKVDGSWDNNTLDIEAKLNDEITNNKLGKEAEAKAALKAIEEAKEAAKLLATATDAHSAAKKAAQAQQDVVDQAEADQQTTNTALKAKNQAFKDATAAVDKLNTLANATADTPAFEQTIALGEKQTVDTDAVAVDTKVAGGQQDVTEKGTIINSVITDGGNVNLAVGALAHGTVITKGTLNNNGGTDIDTAVGAEGKLVLQGEKVSGTTGTDDVINIAKSFDAQVAEGGKATVGEYAEIHNLRSGKGIVELQDGAKAFNTLIDGGTFTIAQGAVADNTTLLDVKLNLVEGATADNTHVGKDAHFTLEDQAKTTGTHVENGGKFTLDNGSEAELTNITEGTMTVNDGAIAKDTTLVSEYAELILKSGAKAENTKVHDRAIFTINKGAKALNTELHFTDLDLVAGAQADGTKLYNGSKFTLQDGAETQDTYIGSGSTFTVNVGAKATNTTLASDSSTFVLQGSADNTIIDGGVFDVQDGAKATNTTLNEGDFKLAKNATADNTTMNGGTFTLANKATATGTIINGGVFDVLAGAVAKDTQVKKGKFNLMARAQAHKLVVENGDAFIAGELNGDTVLNGGKTTLTKTAVVNGKIDATKNSFIAVHDGANTQDVDLNLAGNMVLVSPAQAASNFARSARAVSHPQSAQFAFKDVKLNGGNIDMSQSNTQLNMKSLAGKGSFNLGSTLNNQANAPINILGNADGDFDIQIDSTGVAPNNLNIMNVKGKNRTNLRLANGPVDLGNYQHNLVSDGQGGFKLVADKNTLTRSAAGALAVANTTPVIFDAELSSIHNRLDAQRSAGNESGVWANYLNNNYQVKGAAANFDQKLNGVTLGGDKAIDLGDATLSLGGFASHSSSSIKSDYQSSGSVESNSLGAYAQYLANSGYYFNTVLKTNQFKQNLSVTSKDNNASGATNFSGLGLAVKAGKHINVDAMYVSPYVGLSNFTSGKAKQQLSNGMVIENQGSSTTTGTLGVNTGYRFVLNNGVSIAPYGALSYAHDLSARNDVMINKEKFDNSQKGSRTNAGVGINVNLTRNLSVNSEVMLSKGKKVETPMTINLGVAYTF